VAKVVTRPLSTTTRRMLLGCAKCGVTVLDVERLAEHSPYGPLFTEGALTVGPVNVRRGGRRDNRFTMHRHLPAADANPTYTWTCSNCGHRDSRRHDRILAAWPRWNPDATTKPPRVLRLRLGVDL
jgi:hypothetical protein